MQDIYGWVGQFKIQIKEKGVIKDTHIVDNRITNLALDAIINLLDNIDPNLDIKYIAIGDSAAAVNDNATQLGNEIFRAQIDTGSRTAIGIFNSTFSILDSEAVGQWEEIGIFCGDGATASANTGNMLSRILFSRTKTALEEISITRIDKIIRA